MLFDKRAFFPHSAEAAPTCNEENVKFLLLLLLRDRIRLMKSCQVRKTHQQPKIGSCFFSIYFEMTK